MGCEPIPVPFRDSFVWGYNSFHCATHLNKDTFETNLSVPEISRCRETILIKDFKMNPQYDGVQNPFMDQVWIRDLG